MVWTQTFAALEVSRCAVVARPTVYNNAECQQSYSYCTHGSFAHWAEHLSMPFPHILYISSGICLKLCAFLDIFMDNTCLLQHDFMPVWTKMHLLKLQSRWRSAKLSQNWLFRKTVCQFLHKQLCLPSILTFWPWLEATLAGSKICGGSS